MTRLPAQTGGPRLVLARGARACEAAVLDRLEELLAAAVGDPALLARPVRVIVPSRSLRLHLSAALVRRRRRPAAGVAVQTLYAAALEVLERAAAPAGALGPPLPWGRHLAEVLARRLARDEPELARPLDGLVDGYAAVDDAVRDLLDAGLEPVHAAAADEALASDGPAVATRAQVARARALVRVAARLAEGIDALGVRRTSTLLRWATELVVAAPQRALPARAILVHGLADAPGVTLDFLAALLRHLGAEVFVDLPPDPAGESTGDGAAGHPFTSRLRERLATVAGLAEVDLGAGAAAVGGESAGETPAAFAASGVDPEAREVARRLRALLDAGVEPEAIALVARDLERYRLPLRRHLEAVGVPFSGVGAGGSLTLAGRRAAALRDLLRRGPDLPADRWLDAARGLRREGDDGAGGPLAVDLRLAFYALGAGRLRDVAALDVERYLRGGFYYLPVRQGLREAVATTPGGEGGEAVETEPETDSDGETGEASETAGGRSRRRHRGSGALRRRLRGDHLRRAVSAARALLRRLEEWPRTAPASAHFERLATLLDDDLGWPPSGEAREAIAEAARSLPTDFALTVDELRLLLDRALEGAGFDDLGGRGGGVQVLTVIEARGRTFDHLFLPGLNRGVFPRTVRQDPMLSDELRGVLARVLPDVPLRQRGFDEERYLFAQLLSASPGVTLSWPLADLEGRPLAASPLVERLAGRLGHSPPDAGPPRAPAAFAPSAAALRPAREQAVLAALYGPRDGLGRLLAAATREARDRARGEGRALDLDPAAVAAARLAVLAELDPDRRTPEGRAAARRLGPFFGFVGPATHPDDPRRRDLYVTLLERLAACPWQTFLERVLGLEPTPDPLQALPGVDPLLLGNLVHRVLEEVVSRTLPEPPPTDLDEARRAAPVAVAWPASKVLARLAAAAAERLVEAEGVALPGLARALVERALPYLDEAQRADWSGPAAAVPAVGVEIEGAVEIRDGGGAPRRLFFKADRVDAVDGRLRLTDLKTGAPISKGKREGTRRRHLLDSVRAGSRLQAVAYALATAGGEGRYLFLRPEIPHREFAVEAGDEAFAQAFAVAAAAALDAWDAGAFVPRVVDPQGRNEPPRCSWCAVAEACLRGDSGARKRLAEWTARPARAGEEGAPGAAETALIAVWQLPARERGGSQRGARR